MVASVCVVGAGVVGLSTAVVLQEKIPGLRVTIIADQTTSETTSDGAGGLFTADAVGVPVHFIRKWGKASADHFYKLALSEESKESGVFIIHGYNLFTKPITQLPGYLEFALGYRPLSDRELALFQPRYVAGYQVTTVIAEGRKYLPWLTAKFLERGGVHKIKKLQSLDELSGQYDVVVNCTGLGSRELEDDKSLRPLRGHLLRLHAPWIKFFLFSDDRSDVIPSSETVAVGTIRDMDNNDLTPNPNDTQRLLKNAVSRLPALKGAQMMWEWVGLRPYRDPLRLETEIRPVKGRTLKIVHNYGHGMYGVSLSWGTAVHVTELVQSLLASSRL